jgi:hypothetical protein
VRGGEVKTAKDILIGRGDSVNVDYTVDVILPNGNETKVALVVSIGVKEVMDNSAIIDVSCGVAQGNITKVNRIKNA